MSYTYRMTEHELTYPRTVECIDSHYGDDLEDWLTLNKGEMITDVNTSDHQSEYNKWHETDVDVTIDLISNVMTDTTPIGSMCEVYDNALVSYLMSATD